MALFILSLIAIAAVWWWIATPINLARAPIDPAAKLECVSYAPFRGAQNPLEPGLMVTPEQMAEDFAQLAKITPCIRTYSTGNGMDKVPELARKAGLKVMQGIWIGTNRNDNRIQIETASALAKNFPDVITSVIVGNEVLLRGEMTAADLVGNIRNVKSKVGAAMPVTYADVWEFWLKNRELYEAVDFVTIHILPYWEDFPIRARHAASHVDSIRKRMAVAFPNKEIIIGETGWPSAGRMREGALPSRANQAKVVSEILEIARQNKYRVNLIEAYDQPWKRMHEGTVGGYWGLFGAEPRDLKYPAGVPISNFPMAKIYAGAGMVLAALVFGVSLLTLRRRPWSPHLSSWIAVALCATSAGALFGIAFEKVVVESLGIGGWIKGVLLLIAAVATPLIVANTVMYGRTLPTFLELVGPREDRTSSRMQRLLGLATLITVLIAAETALGFVFDARYRDFQFAAFTMAVLPLALLVTLNPPGEGSRPIAESVFAGLLAISAIYVAFNEGPSNWQSLWTCGIYLLLALTLSRARVAQSPK